MMNANNFPDLPHQAVYLPPSDDKLSNFDLGGWGEDIAYP